MGVLSPAREPILKIVMVNKLWAEALRALDGYQGSLGQWLKASKALKKENQVYGQKLAKMAKKHSSEASYALDDPLEQSVSSMLVEMMRKR